MLFKSLPICLLALIFDATTSSATLVPRALQKAHQVAVHHTHSLAHDLRVAFGAVLVQRASTFDPNHVVYCKNSKQTVLGGGTSGTSNGTSPSPSPSPASGTSKRPSATSTRTSTGSAPTTSVLTSSWTLLESYVRLLLVLMQPAHSPSSKGAISSMDGTSLLVVIRPMVGRLIVSGTNNSLFL